MEKSKHIRFMTQLAGKPQYLEIKHNGARRANCLNAIRKSCDEWISAQIDKGLNNKISCDSRPIKENGRIVGYL